MVVLAFIAIGLVGNSPVLVRPKFCPMPFKTFTFIVSYIGPKPSKLIRYLLYHIRLLVGRPNPEQGN